jgi:hypothetical protein
MMLSHHLTDHALKRALTGANGYTVSVLGSPPSSALLYSCFWRDASRPSSRNLLPKKGWFERPETGMSAKSLAGESAMAMSIVRLTLIVMGTGALFGLAVLGSGGFAAFFSQPALTALAIATFAMFGAALFAGGNVSPGEREDRANRWVLIAFTLIGLLDAYLPAYTVRKEF